MPRADHQRSDEAGELGGKAAVGEEPEPVCVGVGVGARGELLLPQVVARARPAALGQVCCRHDHPKALGAKEEQKLRVDAPDQPTRSLVLVPLLVRRAPLRRVAEGREEEPHVGVTLNRRLLSGSLRVAPLRRVALPAPLGVMAGEHCKDVAATAHHLQDGRRVEPHGTSKDRLEGVRIACQLSQQVGAILAAGTGESDVGPG